MALKLFRDTEFASSSLTSHKREELAMHPLGLVALASVWMAVLGNLTLWQTLLQLPSEGILQVCCAAACWPFRSLHRWHA